MIMFKLTPNLKEEDKWYVSSEQLKKDAGALSFAEVLGLPIELKGNSNLTTTKFSKIIPGVAIIDMIPSIGISKDHNSLVNTAFRRIYSNIRAVNAGAKNYEYQDLAIINLCLGSLYAAHAHMRRTYRILRTYRGRNRNIPRSIFIGLGLDYDDFMSNMADFRYRINLFTAKLNSLVGYGLPIFKRWYYTQCNAYAEGDNNSDKAQLYLFNFKCWYKYQAYDALTGGRAELVDAWNSQSIPTFQELTMDQYMSFFEGLLDVLYYDDDVSLIMGDTLKYIKDGERDQVEEVSENEELQIILDLDVLSQIQNATLVGELCTPCYITQSAANGGFIGFDPKFTQPYNADWDPNSGTPSPWFPFGYAWPMSSLSVKANGLSTNRILNSYKNDVSPSDVLRSSRLMVVGDLEDSNGIRSLTSSGTEIALYMRIVEDPTVTFRDTFEHGNVLWYDVPIQLNSDCQGLITDRASALFAKVEKFDFHPYAITMKCDYVMNTNDIIALYGDSDNYTIVSDTEINRFHNTCLITGYDIK
nr:putative capsid protein [Picobirnavirus sp.]